MASQLTLEEVQRIADLARIELLPDDAVTFARQLTAILEYAAHIQRVETDGVPPTPGPPAAVWREDAPAPSLSRDIVLDEAPDAERGAGLFRVPKVI